ncbi:MAG: YfiR family protein [Pseudomonadota bacterium]
MRPILRALMLLLAMLAPLACAADLAQERSVKAAFLSKFIGFVELEEASTPIIIGVMGADDIAAELKRIMASRPPNLRPVQVRTLGVDDTLAGVHMLFVGGDQSDRTEQVLNAAARQGILTVTEVDSGLRLGSMINFRRVDERVRFEVSLPAAQRSNVKLSARLLSVAYHVLKER